MNIYRKGSIGDDTMTTVVGLLLVLAFVALAATIIMGGLTPTAFPQFSILSDFSGGF